MRVVYVPWILRRCDEERESKEAESIYRAGGHLIPAIQQIPRRSCLLGQSGIPEFATMVKSSTNRLKLKSLPILLDPLLETGWSLSGVLQHTFRGTLILVCVQ